METENCEMKIFIERMEAENKELASAKAINIKDLRVELVKAIELGAFSYDLPSVEQVCQLAKANAEYTRLQAMIYSCFPHLKGEGALPDNAKAQGKIKRLVSTWVLNIKNTSERCNVLVNELDHVADHNPTLQKICSRIGTGRSLSTTYRQKLAIAKVYDRIFSERLESLLFPSGDDLDDAPFTALLLRWDDDLTVGSQRRIYRNKAHRNNVHRLTMIALKIVSSIAAPRVATPLEISPRVPLNSLEEKYISKLETVDFIMQVISQPRSFYQKCKVDGLFGIVPAMQPSIVEPPAQIVAAGNLLLTTAQIDEEEAKRLQKAQRHEESYLTYGNIANRSSVVCYALQEKARIDRQSRQVLLQEVLDQPFRSYINFGTALLRTLKSRVVFDLLESYYIPDSGDCPKHMCEDKLARQVEQPEGPAHLGAILKVCCPEYYDDIANEFLPEYSAEEQLTTIGTRASRIVQVPPTLHPQIINLSKDVGNFSFHFLIKPFFEMTAGVKCPVKMHIRMLRGLLEALVAAYHELRDNICSLLAGIHHRPDVDAFVNIFENTMFLTCMPYQLLKNGESSHYYDSVAYSVLQAMCHQRKNYFPLLMRQIAQMQYFKRVSHSMRVMNEEALHVNDEFGEYTTNCAASPVLQDSVDIESSIAKIKRQEARKLDNKVRSFESSFNPSQPLPREFQERKMEWMIEQGVNFLTDIVVRLATASPSNGMLPTRVSKGSARRNFTTQAWLFPALIPPEPVVAIVDGAALPTSGTSVKKPLKIPAVYSHEVCSLAYVRTDAGQLVKPDLDVSPNGCNYLSFGCPGIAGEELMKRKCLCGHSSCSTCGERIDLGIYQATIEDKTLLTVDSTGCVVIYDCPICHPDVRRRMLVKITNDQASQANRLEISDLLKDFNDCTDRPRKEKVGKGLAGDDDNDEEDMMEVTNEDGDEGIPSTSTFSNAVQSQKELVLGVAKERLYNVVIPQVHASAMAQVLSVDVPALPPSADKRPSGDNITTAVAKKIRTDNPLLHTPTSKSKQPTGSITSVAPVVAVATGTKRSAEDDLTCIATPASCGDLQTSTKKKTQQPLAPLPSVPYDFQNNFGTNCDQTFRPGYVANAQ